MRALFNRIITFFKGLFKREIPQIKCGECGVTAEVKVTYCGSSVVNYPLCGGCLDIVGRKYKDDGIQICIQKM